MQPVTLQFCESPRSPLRRARTRISLSPIDQPAVISRKCKNTLRHSVQYIYIYILHVVTVGEFVGSLSAVNAHLSAEGFLRQAPIQPLVSEIALKPTTPNAVRKLKRNEKKSQVYIYIFNTHSWFELLHLSFEHSMRRNKKRLH